MKLLEYLVGSLDSWPIGYQRISQRSDGWLVASAGFGVWYEYGVTGLMEDQKTAVVTRAQWEAERARIAEEKCTECDSGIVICTEGSKWPCYNGCKGFGAEDKLYRQSTREEQELTAIACGKSSKEDQALWDKVAISALGGFFSRVPHIDHVTATEEAFAAADWFVAERAKRIKGL